MSFLGYSNELRRGGGALIVNRAREALLVLRGAKSRNDQGFWSQPGGAVDGDDPTPEAAVEREILEELGVRITIERFLTTTCHADQECQWLAYSYLGRLAEGEVTRREPEKHESVKWFPLDQLPANTNLVTREAVQTYQSPPRSAGRTGLLVLDMDGTLLPGTTANVELGRVLEADSLVAELEHGYRAGAIDNHAYASRILDLYSRLSETQVEEAFRRAPKLHGLRDLVTWARARGIEVAVLTTGPHFFARKFAEHFEFDHVVGGVFPVHRGAIEIAACDVLRDGDKPARARTLCASLGVCPSRCVVVGDSRSDIALFEAFPSSIALNWDESLLGKARYYLRTLFAQDLVPAVAHFLG